MKQFLTKSLQKKILKSSVISFDVFDTLLLRPYIRPTDLFLHMEKHYNRPYFHDCRISAEWAAREKSNAVDITFDEIYDNIDDNFKDLKQAELDWERMVLRANPQMQEVYNFAIKNGKRVVIASDMYLPTKFIDEILKKNGYIGYEKLYVSGESGVAKYNGTMFDLIIKDMNVKPSEILHIGDNRDSDYKKPRKHGLNAIKYSAPVSDFTGQNPRIQMFCDKTKNDLGASILVAMLAYRGLANSDDNYWHNLGYEYGGPVIYGYMRFVEKISKERNINNLMFVARDGYTMQRVFNTFNNDISNSYVYAPRFLNLICRLNYDKYEASHAMAIINYFAKKDKKIDDLRKKSTLQSWQDYDEFIQNNKKLFTPLADKESKQYKKYLETNIKTKGKVGIVDSLTLNFSSQGLIEHILNRECFGLYWTTKTVLNHYYEHKPFLNPKQEDEYKQTKNWNFMEFLMTAPEYPIKQLNPDGTPVYDSNPSDAEKIRKKVYPYVSSGAIDFANEVKKLFGGADIYLSGPGVVDWVNCFCDTPTKLDFQNMQNIKHAWDSAHSNYQPLFCAKITLLDYLLHPKRTRRISKSCIWHKPSGKFVNVISKPIRIKMRGIKQIRIVLFPRMAETHFNFTLRFTKNYFYQITIGKEL